METYKELPIRAFASASEWRKWLDENHASPSGIWLMFAKKGSGATTLTYEEARDTAIAYGWIDGLINKFDDTYYLTRFTARRPKSVWSKVNREVAEALIAASLMHAAGMRHVEAARKDGRWDRAYDAPSRMTIPGDFQEALDQNAAAARYFAGLTAANRYSFLYRIQTGGTAQVRSARIEKFIAMLSAGECFHPDAERIVRRGNREKS